MNLDSLVSRADEDLLQNVLGKGGVKLIGLLDPTLSSPTKLRQLVLNLNSRENLLLSNRKILLDLLRKDEAIALVKVLGIRDHSDPFYSLKNTKFSKNSDRERLLLGFFNLEAHHEKPVQKPSSEESCPEFTLFKHQRNAIREINNFLNTAPHRVLLHMPTGSGKTRTAMNAVAYHFRRHEPTTAIWLASSEELCEQALGEFQKAWRCLGDRDLKIHKFWGKYDFNGNLPQDGLIIAGLPKIYAAAKKRIQTISELGKRCSLVVIDEAHQAVARTYRLILDALVVHHENTALLGLSATPGRSWADISEDENLADFFSRRKVGLRIEGYNNPVEYLQDEGYLAKVKFKPLLNESGLTLSTADLKAIQDNFDLPDSILMKLAEDEKRNLKVIAAIEDLAKRHKRIIVFAASVAHSGLLSAVLRARGYDAASVTATTPSIERNRIIADFKERDVSRKILCNYGILTAGFDAPNISAAVIARPTTSLVLYSQMVGRVIRGPRANGNREAEIYTIIDHDLPGFRAIAESFSNWDDVWRT